MAESGNINETMDKLKETLNKSKYYQIVKNRFTQDRERLLKFLSTYGIYIILVIILITGVIIYFKHFYCRVERYLKPMNVYDEILNLQSLSSCKSFQSGNKKGERGDYKLCDYYIASSYKSYLPCTNYYDYGDIRSVEKVLRYGARYIDLDIYNKDFSQCSEPVIANGTEVGQWKWTTPILFDDCIKMISQVAFSSELRNRNDPLFINLNLYVNGNKTTINKVYDIIVTHLGHKLLPRKYNYQGYDPNPNKSVNLITTPIRKLFNKVIIVCDDNFKKTKLDEIVHLSPKSNGNFRNLNDLQVKESHDPNELKNFNKKNMTKVIPHFSGRNKENFNYATSWYLGCQFICMNYTHVDDIMVEYIRRFKNSSFILKPYKLRYYPKLIAPPKKQLKQVSFAPEKVSTPFYSITY